MRPAPRPRRLTRRTCHVCRDPYPRAVAPWPDESCPCLPDPYAHWYDDDGGDEYGGWLDAIVPGGARGGAGPLQEMLDRLHHAAYWWTHEGEPLPLALVIELSRPEPLAAAWAAPSDARTRAVVLALCAGWRPAPDGEPRAAAAARIGDVLAAGPAGPALGRRVAAWLGSDGAWSEDLDAALRAAVPDSPGSLLGLIADLVAAGPAQGAC